MNVTRLSLLCIGVFVSSGWSASANTTLPTGNGQPFQNEQPSLVLNYIVNISGGPDDLGEVGMFAGNFAPRGWAFAHGQPLDVSENSDLFDKLGTTFGGDGVTSFALPDLRGRSAIGAGSGPDSTNYMLGQQVGSQQVTLGSSPQHRHDIGTGYLTELAGNATAHSNMQPSLALTPIIATQGLFPSRNLSASTDSDLAPFGIGVEPYLGEVTWLAHDDVPTGWARADGTLLSIASHQALFSILGNTYGGDGRVDFALPDLRGRTPVGVGQGPGLPNHPLGQEYGDTEETLNLAQLPSHDHSLPDNLGSTNSTGGSGAQSNLQPALPLTHLFAVEGTYPSRNLAALGSGPEPYIASVSMFAGNYAPRSYMMTDGQVLDISTYTAAFSLVGDIYGGDGRSNFGLPDLRGRTIVGEGQGIGLSNRALGQEYGQETSILSTSNLPSHTHEFTVLAGDFDLDGDVDGYDFLMWQRGESPNPLSNTDLTAWQNNYEMTVPLSASSTAVPEQTSAMLVVVASMACCALRQQSAGTRNRC
ncbi:MAG: tail fiber protein [Bythopirellula sp.]